MRPLLWCGLVLAFAVLLPGPATGQERGGGRAVVREGDLAVFPFGRGQPTVVCAEMRICTIELQAGEEVSGAPLLADSETWSVVVYAFGEGVHRRAELAVKPLLCGVSTNLVVPTTKRRYELSLLSAPCRAVDDWDHNAVYTRRVRFSYPDDAEWREAQSEAAEAAQARDTAAVRLADGVEVEDLRFDYTWRRRNGFPWEPVQVFDDGKHTYIRIPEEARQYELPILYVVEESGQRSVLNYEPPHATGYFKTDRVVPHLALVLGGGRTPKVLHIYNRRLGGR